MMVIDNKFELGDIVYLLTDAEQLKRIVCAIQVHPNGQLLYDLTAGTATSTHYDFEMSKEEDYFLKNK